MPPPMITTRAWDGMLGTESPPATVHWIHRPPQAQPGYGSVLRDRLAQHRAHQVDIGAAGDEGRRHDRDIAGGLHVQAAIKQLRLQLVAAHAWSLAGFDLDRKSTRLNSSHVE